MCDIVVFFPFGSPLEHTSDLAFTSFSYLYVIPCLSGSHWLPAALVATAV